MSQYTLTLNIDAQDLTYIKAAQQRITLGKTVGGDQPNVIWLSIDPFQANTVQWTDDVWIYASTTQVTSGASILKLSEVQPGPALDGGYYPFTAAAVFNDFVSSTDVPAGTYAANNDMPASNYPLLTFGLSQSAQVNAVPVTRKPISARMVLATQRIFMTPNANVYVWLQSQFASETIITSIVGRHTIARFGGGVTDIALKYDLARGLFVPDPSASTAQELVDHVEPLVV